MGNILTSIAEHSDWLFNQHIRIDEKWDLHRQRVLFGKQPLAIWQFVPCKLVDGEWVVLEEPKNLYSDSHDKSMSKMYRNSIKVKEFQEAKSRCFFEGWKTELNHIIDENFNSIFFEEKIRYYNGVDVVVLKTIEDIVKYNLELTPNALKDSGYE